MGYSHERYAQLLDETIAKVKELGRLKGGEYAGDDDRLANFRRNGLALGLPMETIWAVYAAKHWDAIQQSIKDLQHNKQRQRLESLEGRVDDLITYLVLFRAMIDEREQTSPISKAQIENQKHVKAVLDDELIQLAARAGAEVNKAVGWPFKKVATTHGDFGSLQPTDT